MSYPSEKIRITPLLANFSTVGATSLQGKARYNGQGNFSVLCGVRGSTVQATGQSATVVMNYDWSVMESTAASVAGSVITRATMTLGAATALTLRGAVQCVLKVASDLATTATVVINGLSYSCSAAGATAANGAVKLARAINGLATLSATAAHTGGKLPHYSAIANFSSANLLLITADDDQGTGLTVTATSGGPQIFIGDLQGVINVAAANLSSNTPKYIGVGCTFVGAGGGVGDTAIHYAQMISWPSAAPAMPGVQVNCTT